LLSKWEERDLKNILAGISEQKPINIGQDLEDEKEDEEQKKIMEGVRKKNQGLAKASKSKKKEVVDPFLA